MEWWTFLIFLIVVAIFFIGYGLGYRAGWQDCTLGHTRFWREP